MQYPRALKNNNYHSNKRVPWPFFSFRYQSCVWPRSDPFFWQNPCSGCNSGIDLVVALEYTFFQLCSNVEQISVWLTRCKRNYVKHPAGCCSNQPHKLHSVFAWYALRCSKWPRFFFCSCLPPMIVYLRNLFLLNTPLARMLLTPRWVSRQKDEKKWNSYP